MKPLSAKTSTLITCLYQPSLSLVSDVLHSWPEYYDVGQKLWIPIDPTWANTTGGVNYFDKLDYNHIALSIHGQASTYPYPAGFYKKAGKNSKDVRVEFSDTFPAPASQQLAVSYAFPPSVSSGFAAKGSVIRAGKPCQRLWFPCSRFLLMWRLYKHLPLYRRTQKYPYRFPYRFQVIL